MFIVFETWEFELLTSDIYRPVYKSRHQSEVNPDQEKTKSKPPREGNFHDAGFLPPHPHLLHHWHWVGWQSSRNHTSIYPWNHYIQTITVVFTRFWHCTHISLFVFLTKFCLFQHCKAGQTLLDRDWRRSWEGWSRRLPKLGRWG